VRAAEAADVVLGDDPDRDAPDLVAVRGVPEQLGVPLDGDARDADVEGDGRPSRVCLTIVAAPAGAATSSAARTAARRSTARRTSRGYEGVVSGA
jgi:hypothetical protein